MLPSKFAGLHPAFMCPQRRDILLFS
jgi:hypothetical protein